MDSPKIKIGIIGGTGLNNPDLLKNIKEFPVTTPFGPPSDGSVLTGTIFDVPCVLIARHGRQHQIPPSKVNFRANIFALRNLGVTHVIATTATGSLRESIKPGDLVIPHDFIDRTYKREQSFYSGDNHSLPGVFHLPMHPPFSEPLRETIIKTAEELGMEVHKSGTVVTIEGPRFSSQAESKMYQLMGCDIVNMTTVPEVMLAKEAGLLYAAIAMATDYDCWKEDHVTVSHSYVQEIFKSNVDKITKLIIAVIKNISAKEWNKEVSELKEIVNNSLM